MHDMLHCMHLWAIIPASIGMSQPFTLSNFIVFSCLVIVNDWIVVCLFKKKVLLNGNFDDLNRFHDCFWHDAVHLNLMDIHIFMLHKAIITIIVCPSVLHVHFGDIDLTGSIYTICVFFYMLWSINFALTSIILLAAMSPPWIFHTQIAHCAKLEWVSVGCKRFPFHYKHREWPILVAG